jgi:hypothetical protein
MRSREESSLKTDALRYLADALSEDIAATPEPKILTEERDDSAQRPPLAIPRLCSGPLSVSSIDRCPARFDSLACFDCLEG